MLPFMLDSFEGLPAKILPRKPNGEEVSEFVDVDEDEDAMLVVLVLLVEGIVCCMRISDISNEIGWLISIGYVYR